MSRCLAAAALVFAACSAPALAQPLFEDNFNTANGGVGTLNYTGFTQWTVTAGSVDIIGNGLFDLFPSTPALGLYVDLDGTTGAGGTLTSILINFAPGTYDLSFVLAGSQRGDTNVVSVSLGGLYSEVFTLASNAPYQTFTRQFTVTTATSASLAFSNAGGDNFGAILDNVLIVPAPGAAALVGVAGLAMTRRRR